MNPLDIILSGIVIIAALSAKYSGFFRQINILISMIMAIIFTKLLLYKLIGILYPILGLDGHTKTFVYFGAIFTFYISINLIFSIFLYQNEPYIKNRLLESFFGIALGLINTLLTLSLILSVMFKTVEINYSISKKLEKSNIFNLLNYCRISFIDYE